MKISDRFDLKMGMQYYFTTTDYVDGITNNSLGTRAGNSHKDNFVYTSFALQYDLVFVNSGKEIITLIPASRNTFAVEPVESISIPFFSKLLPRSTKPLLS